MTTLRKSGIYSLLLLGLLLLPPPYEVEAFSKDLNDRLANAKYVYVSSTRKDGTLGKPAEIWFLYVNETLYVGTKPSSWRVRRIKAGRPQAKIWVGEPDGPSRFTATEREIQHLPSFNARGELVKDAKLEEKMFEVFAKKYADRWGDHESDFRNGFKDGSRVMVKYTPSE
jgi:hypothetical protein